MTAVAIALLSSCAKEEISAPEYNVDSNLVQFTAAFEEQTKTAIDEEGCVTWAAGDAIKFNYVIDKEYASVTSSPLTLDDIDGEEATFSAAIPEVFSMTKKEYATSLDLEKADDAPVRRMYVSYPASLQVDYTTPSYYVTIPATQDGNFASASIAVAKWVESKPRETLHFRNLCALVKLTVPADYSTVREIRFTNAGRSIVGKADLTFPTAAAEIKGMVEGESSSTVTVKVNGPGTYYAAVAPGEFKDICLAYFDADGNSVGELVTPNGFNAERSRVYNITKTAEAGNFPGQGGYFVKPTACGTKDGSSWDNAADYAALHNLLDNQTTAGDKTMTVYMAGGTYKVPAQLNVSKAHNVKIYGSYPSNATGCSLSGRDVVANSTILEPATTNKIWNLTTGTWVIDGVTIQNVKVADAAVVLKNDISFTLRNSTFRNNETSGSGGAAIFTTALTSQNVVFENCVFSGNKATTTGEDNKGLGGAIGAFGSPSTFGTLTFKNCLFEKNEAFGGGVICSRKANCRFIGCNFVDNKAENGDDIYVENSYAVSVYCEGCNFYKTSKEYVKAGAMIDNQNSNATVGLNNCVVTGAWNVGDIGLCYNNGKNFIVANSTLFCQSDYPALLTGTKGTTYVINSIVLNAARKGVGRGVATNGKSYLYNLICTKVDEKGIDVIETTEKTEIGQILKVVSHQNETFPVKPTWYGSKDGADYMWGNKNASTTTVGDCRGKYYYYAWDGVYPETFTNATLGQVTDWVTKADADFATWLGDRLGKDIRGVQRNANSMWPGSYQK